MKLANTVFFLLAVICNLWTTSEAACNEDGIGASLVMFLGILGHSFENGSRINRRRKVYIKHMQPVGNPPNDCDVDVKVDYYLDRKVLKNKHYSMTMRMTYEWADDFEPGSFCITDAQRISGSSSYQNRVRSIILGEPCVARRRRRNLRGDSSDGLEEMLLSGKIQDIDSLGALDESLEVSAELSEVLKLSEGEAESGED